MLKVRLIPVLYLMNGLIVRSEKFSEFKVIGNPIAELERYNEWDADEVIYLDITRAGNHDFRRSDHAYQGVTDRYQLVRQIASQAFMPLTFGGGVRTLQDFAALIANGADKVAINTAAYETPSLVSEAAQRFGSQAVVVSIDADADGWVVTCCGSKRQERGAVEWAAIAERYGAGEILLNSIDRDGTGEGYDLELIKAVAEAVAIPVIACGGAGAPSDFIEALHAGAHAVAAGNMMHFTEHAYARAKAYLAKRGVAVRMDHVKRAA